MTSRLTLLVLLCVAAFCAGCGALAGVDFGAGHAADIGVDAAGGASDGTGDPGTDDGGATSASDAADTGDGQGGDGHADADAGDADGALSGECTEGDADCGNDGKTPRACIQGAWVAKPACADPSPVCAKGLCKGQCNDGDMDCAGDTPRLCSQGHWLPQTACAGTTPVCAQGACVECASGIAGCVDAATPKVCKNGQWSTLPACGGNTPDCALGACAACANAGPIACLSDRTLRSCTATGAYATTTVCADGHSACPQGQSACGVCPSGWANCNDGTDGCETRIDPVSNCAACQTPDRTCYRDKDSDGYGDSTDTSAQCGACPAGWAPVGNDCDDANSKTHPGATAPQFTLPAGASTWDTNCDGVVAIGAVDKANPATTWSAAHGGSPAVLDCHQWDTDQLNCQSVKYGFVQAPACGASATEFHCLWQVTFCANDYLDSTNRTWNFTCM